MLFYQILKDHCAKELMQVHKSQWVGRHIGRQVGRWIGRQVDRQADRQVGGQMKRYIKRQVDKNQIQRYKDKAETEGKKFGRDNKRRDKKIRWKKG